MSYSGNKYNYIIAGAGSSGLSLAWHMKQAGLLQNNRLLVIDKDLTPKNDKTWCFWEKGKPVFKQIVHKKWVYSDIFVNGNHYHEQLQHYPYYSIKSGRYRSAILEQLEDHSNVKLLEFPITKLQGNKQFAELFCQDRRYEADYIFQSCFKPDVKRSPRYPLLQHFLGWEINTSTDLFDDESFTLMDFDDTYKDGIAFMYVLPWDRSTALLEYTLFSKNTERFSVYEKKLELYLYNKYGIKPLDYEIERVEFGSIPMDDSILHSWYAPRILNLGVNAGLTKPSTGYTFRRIQEHSHLITESLKKDGKPVPAPRSERRYRAYDLWLLQILHDHPEEAHQVFQSLFMNNSLDEVFRFLGEETHLGQDLKIMASVPWWPFLRAIWKTRNSLFSY